MKSAPDIRTAKSSWEAAKRAHARELERQTEELEEKMVRLAEAHVMDGGYCSWPRTIYRCVTGQKAYLDYMLYARFLAKP